MPKSKVGVGEMEMQGGGQLGRECQFQVGPPEINPINRCFKFVYHMMQAFGSSVRYGSPNPINDALPVLAQRACDPTPSVRSCLADTIGMWLLELPDR